MLASYLDIDRRPVKLTFSPIWGGDLLGLCHENIVYRCDLAEGIRRQLLCPFRCFDVPDEVDYSAIPWRSTRFDEEALTRAVATRRRAEDALEHYRQRGGRRTLAFCVSQTHADFMASFFRDQGVPAVAVHSGETSAPRAVSLESLQSGNPGVVFAVDMFNEGIDLPDLDTVMMLRRRSPRYCGCSRSAAAWAVPLRQRS
jgi:superfamily II DNA or RNA helicase